MDWHLTTVYYEGGETQVLRNDKGGYVTEARGTRRWDESARKLGDGWSLTCDRGRAYYDVMAVIYCVCHGICLGDDTP